MVLQLPIINKLRAVKLTINARLCCVVRKSSYPGNDSLQARLFRT